MLSYRDRMNFENNHLSRNDCENIVKDLLEFASEMLSDVFDHQWEKCELYSKQCSCQNVWDVVHSMDVPNPCSHELCTMLLRGKTLLRRKRIPFNTLLMNFTAFVYHEQRCLFKREFAHIAVTKAMFLPRDYHETSRNLAALQGRPEFFRMLLNLNLVSDFSNAKVVLIITAMRRNLRQFISSHAGNFRVNSLVEWVMEYVKRDFFRRSFLGVYQRIYLATIAILATQFMLKKEENTAKKYIHCLRMYFVATREPLITLYEIKKMLFVCLEFNGELRTLLHLYSKEFEILMPECSEKFEPRNLSDLARCQIRNNLTKCNVPLAKSVQKLSLPSMLKEFVIGDIIAISHARGILFSKNINYE